VRFPSPRCRVELQAVEAASRGVREGTGAGVRGGYCYTGRGGRITTLPGYTEWSNPTPEETVKARERAVPYKE